MAQQQTERERWNERYATADPQRRKVGRLLVDNAAHLPEEGRALDVAGGDGIEACWLALRGLHTSLLDVSDVGLAKATDLAGELGVTIEPLLIDLDEEPLPEGPWDLIHIGHFLDRKVLTQAFERCRDVLMVAIATEQNLERHERPPRHFLLEEGELASIVEAHGQDFEIVTCDEDWRPNGNHEAWLVACRR